MSLPWNLGSFGDSYTPNFNSHHSSEFNYPIDWGSSWVVIIHNFPNIYIYIWKPWSWMFFLLMNPIITIIGGFHQVMDPQVAIGFHMEPPAVDPAKAHWDSPGTKSRYLDMARHWGVTDWIWISTDIYGYLWVSLISMDIYGFLWISMDFWFGYGENGVSHQYWTNVTEPFNMENYEWNFWVQ